MRLYLLPSQDTTIYERYPTFNSGLDEVLEVGKLKKSTDVDNYYASASARILLNFDLAVNAYPTTSIYYLNLYLANAEYVNRYQQIDVYPISRSWTEGSGYRYQDVRNAGDGATWSKANATENWTTSGSDYTTTISASIRLSDYPLKDVRINVTDIIAPVISGSNTTPWNGLLVKFSGSDENNSSNTGNIKFFSSQTHTVYSPRLEVVYNDVTIQPGSLKPIPNAKVTISPRNLKEGYTKGEIDRIYLVIRDPFPDRRFDATARYKNQYYLPSGSSFRIRDTVSGVTLQNFDQYSAISTDSSGSYISLDTSGMYVDRYYTIDLKAISGSFVYFPEFSYTFKIDSQDA